MYMERAGKEDKEMAERWKSDADSILVFVSFPFAIQTHTPPYGDYRVDYSLLQLQQLLV
jgi:hypothetical protein